MGDREILDAEGEREDGTSDTPFVRSNATQKVHQCRIASRIARFCRFACPTESIIPTATERSS